MRNTKENLMNGSNYTCPDGSEKPVQCGGELVRRAQGTACNEQQDQRKFDEQELRFDLAATYSSLNRRSGFQSTTSFQRTANQLITERSTHHASPLT